MKLTSTRTLALILLASALVWSATPVAADCGRCFSRCISAANQFRAYCDDRCAMDCAAIFPNDPEAYSTCREACHAVCVVAEQEYKVICKTAKDPIPQEP